MRFVFGIFFVKHSLTINCILLNVKGYSYSTVGILEINTFSSSVWPVITPDSVMEIEGLVLHLYRTISRFIFLKHIINAWFHSSATKWMRSAHFWEIRQCLVLLLDRCSLNILLVA